MKKYLLPLIIFMFIITNDRINGQGGIASGFVNQVADFSGYCNAGQTGYASGSQTFWVCNFTGNYLGNTPLYQWVKVTSGPTLGNLNFTSTQPWIDPTGSSFGAKCDGHTDDTASFDLAIAAVPTGGILRIPASATGCIIKGSSVAITALARASGEVTVTVGAVPSRFVQNAPVAISNIPAGVGGTNFNFMCVIDSAPTSTTFTCPQHDVDDTVTLTGSPLASLGLWTNKMIYTQGSLGPFASNAGGPLLKASGTIYLLTATNSNGFASDGVQYQDSNANTTTTPALGGLYLWNMNNFRVTHNFFGGFTAGLETGSALVGIQGGAGLTLDAGGTGTTDSYIQYGIVEHNKFYNDRYLVTTRGRLYSSTFTGNSGQCWNNTGSTFMTGSFGYDFGYTWLTNAGIPTNSGGGENTITGDQLNDCTITAIFDKHNYLSAEGVSELDTAVAQSAGSIAVSVLGSRQSYINWGTKEFATGMHVDTNSINIHVEASRGLGQNSLSTGTNTSDGGSFTNASLVVDSGVRPTFELSGVTQGVFTPNSTYNTNKSTVQTNPMQINISENFCSTNTSSTTIGTHGWTSNLISSGTVAAGNVTGCASKISSAVGSGSGATISLGAGALWSFGDSLNSPFLTDFVFTTSSSIATQGFRIGFGNTFSAVIPTNGSYLCYDTSVGCGGGGNTTDMYFCNDLTSIETCLDSGIAPVASTTYRLEISNYKVTTPTSAYLSFSLFVAGALTVGPDSMCSASCTLTATPYSGSESIFFGVSGYSGSVAEFIDANAAMVNIQGLAR